MSLALEIAKAIEARVEATMTTRMSAAAAALTQAMPGLSYAAVQEAIDETVRRVEVLEAEIVAAMVAASSGARSIASLGAKTIDPKQQSALDESIAAWQEKAKATDPRGIVLSKDNCALCKLYQRGQGCDGCPVKEATGQNFCVGTPYLDAARGHALWRKGSYRGEREFKYFARREVEFLQSLLPEGGAP